jgi:hypothetical protein
VFFDFTMADSTCRRKGNALLPQNLIRDLPFTTVSSIEEREDLLKQKCGTLLWRQRLDQAPCSITHLAGVDLGLCSVCSIQLAARSLELRRRTASTQRLVATRVKYPRGLAKPLARRREFESEAQRLPQVPPCPPSENMTDERAERIRLHRFSLTWSGDCKSKQRSESSRTTRRATTPVSGCTLSSCDSSLPPKLL